MAEMWPSWQPDPRPATPSPPGSSGSTLLITWGQSKSRRAGSWGRRACPRTVLRKLQESRAFWRPPPECVGVGRAADCGCVPKPRFLANLHTRSGAGSRAWLAWGGEVVWRGEGTGRAPSSALAPWSSWGGALRNSSLARAQPPREEAQRRRRKKFISGTCTETGKAAGSVHVAAPPPRPAASPLQPPQGLAAPVPQSQALVLCPSGPLKTLPPCPPGPAPTPPGSPEGRVRAPGSRSWKGGTSHQQGRPGFLLGPTPHLHVLGLPRAPGPQPGAYISALGPVREREVHRDASQGTGRRMHAGEGGGRPEWPFAPGPAQKRTPERSLMERCGKTGAALSAEAPSRRKGPEAGICPPTATALSTSCAAVLRGRGSSLVARALGGGGMGGDRCSLGLTSWGGSDLGLGAPVRTQGDALVPCGAGDSVCAEHTLCALHPVLGSRAPQEPASAPCGAAVRDSGAPGTASDLSPHLGEGGLPPPATDTEDTEARGATAPVLDRGRGEPGPGKRHVLSTPSNGGPGKSRTQGTPPLPGKADAGTAVSRPVSGPDCSWQPWLPPQGSQRGGPEGPERAPHPSAELT